MLSSKDVNRSHSESEDRDQLTSPLRDDEEDDDDNDYYYDEDDKNNNIELLFFVMNIVVLSPKEALSVIMNFFYGALQSYNTKCTLNLMILFLAALNDFNLTNGRAS